MYILALLWMLWCSLHSLLISRFITARMKVVWGVKFAYTCGYLSNMPSGENCFFLARPLDCT
jgi:hypothetical protein